jgi:Holliday junction DNA helicase RuvA
MIASLRGAVLAKTPERVVVEVCGVGYEVTVAAATSAGLPAVGSSVFLHITESVGMHGGGVTLYGFATPTEQELFQTFRDHVPATGAKKALEYLDKASKSLPDFRRAILDKDPKVLSGVFGFSRKTAERLIDALKDEIEGVQVPGGERLVRGARIADGAMGQALSALAALGYKSAEARSALQAVVDEHPGQSLDAELIIRSALKRL